MKDKSDNDDGKSLTFGRKHFFHNSNSRFEEYKIRETVPKDSICVYIIFMYI